MSDQWKDKLSPESYHVAREGGTERPFTGKYNDHSEVGVYHCICCDTPLFTSEAKFDAGCGWPSYFEPINDSVIKEIEDFSHGMSRIETRCANCDAHLGHVFPDGPKETGLRYCINSVSLDFTKKDTPVEDK